MIKLLLNHILLPIIVAILALVNCSILLAENPNVKAITVVASINPLGSVIREICKDSCSVKTLLSGRVDLHAFEPKPSQLKEMAESDLIVFNGGGFEGWAKASLPFFGERVLELSNFSDTLGEDPHLWLDPQRVSEFSNNISLRLCKFRPDQCQEFNQNSADFNNRLVKLDEDVKKSFANVSSKIFLAYHPAWTHYAKHYGLTQLSVLGHDEMQQPSPADLARSIELGKSGKVHLLVVEPSTPLSSLDNLVKSGGFKVVMLDPIGNDGESYIELMRRNSDLLINGLRGASE